MESVYWRDRNWNARVIHATEVLAYGNGWGVSAQRIYNMFYGGDGFILPTP